MAEHWFRWHHGTVNDPKWRVVARKAGARLHEVLAVWAAMLETASQAEDRGTIADWDDEDQAAALDMDSETVRQIRIAMQDKVLDGARLTGWERRQPKREDSSAERMQRLRERRKETHGDPVSVKVTQGDATVTPGDARGEEKRVEEKNSVATQPARGAATENRSDGTPDTTHALRSQAAALIREHLWMGRRPPRDAPSGWDMGRELSVWDQQAQKHGPGEVNAAIPVCRAALGFGGEPLTMLLFNVKGRGDRMQECLGYLRKQLAKEREKETPIVRNIVDAARRDNVA